MANSKAGPSLQDRTRKAKGDGHPKFAGDLSDRQRKMLRVILDFVDEHRRAPTSREILDRVGLKKACKSAMTWHLRILIGKGLLEHEPHMIRGVRVTTAGEKEAAKREPEKKP